MDDEQQSCHGELCGSSVHQRNTVGPDPDRAWFRVQLNVVDPEPGSSGFDTGDADLDAAARCILSDLRRLISDHGHQAVAVKLGALGCC